MVADSNSAAAIVVVVVFVLLIGMSFSMRLRRVARAGRIIAQATRDRRGYKRQQNGGSNT